MSEEISEVSAISSDSSSKTEQSHSASEVQRQSEVQQSQKVEQPKETSATINENDRAELSATREEEAQAHGGAETSGLAGLIAGAWSDPEKADGVEGVKATDETSKTDETEKTGESSAEAAKSVGENSVPANSAEGEKVQSKSLGEKISDIVDKAGDIVNTAINKISGLINGESSTGAAKSVGENSVPANSAEGDKGQSATNGIKDSATVDMLKFELPDEVDGCKTYDELLNKTYENAVPEVKELYEKYEDKIKLSDSDRMTKDELKTFNDDFAETVSKKIYENKKANGEDGSTSLFADPSKAEKSNITDLLNEAQKSVNDGDADGKAKKDQAIEDLKSKLIEAYGEDLDGLKTAVTKDIESTGYNTDNIASAGSVDKIVEELSSLSPEISYYTHSNRSVYLNIPGDITDKNPPGRTYFHEVGHLMDDAAFTLDDNIVYKKIDGREKISDNYEFRDAINNDSQNYFNNYKEEHKNEISHITKYCEGYDLTMSTSDEDKKKIDDIKQYIENHPEISDKYSTEDIVTYRLVRNMMQESVSEDENGNKIDLYETTSDILGGLTDGICQSTWGHSNEYWASDDSRITSETFAHMFQTSIDNGEELQVLKEIFPTAYDKFLEMVKQAS